MKETIHLDRIDSSLIRHLQNDASISNADLAKLVGLSPSACLSRTKRLRESGLIKKITAIVDEKRLGLDVQAFTFLSLFPHNRETTEAFLRNIEQIPRIMECYNISGKFDFLLKVIASDLEDYRDFVIDHLLQIPGVNQVESQVVLKEMKKTYNLPLQDEEK